MEKVPAFIERMQQEEIALAVKIGSLIAFVNNQPPVYVTLPDSEKHLLLAQLHAMNAYHTVLKMRINNALANVQ